MKFETVILLASFAALSLGAPSARYAVHQKRDKGTASQWIKREVELSPHHVIPISIALSQRNLDKGEAFLMDVSDPSSSNYGKHWSPEKILDTFAPSESMISSVKSWLKDFGITEERITLSVGRNWFRMNLTIEEAQVLLKTEYVEYEHLETLKRSLGCEEYSIPVDLRRHIDYVTPTVDTVVVSKYRRRSGQADRFQKTHHPKITKNTRLPPPDIPGSLQKRDSGSNQLGWDLSKCAMDVTLACLRALYNMPNGTLAQSTYAVVEYSQQGYYQSDLNVFLNNLVTVANAGNYNPTMYVMSDTIFQMNPPTYDHDGEGNLDVQLAQGLVYPAHTIYYQVNREDTFLDALDASYCTVIKAGGNCGTVPRADVISVSWGQSEAPNVADVFTRQCNEYMKLGLLGTTMLYSTGDIGVGDGCTQFQVDFPASCPYVTAVGATRIPSGGTYQSKEVASTEFGSGGGFSNLFPMPSYQKSAVAAYYANNAPPYTAAQYNNSRKARGYPDLSANGESILTVLNHGWVNVGGTSASTPIVGGLISLINEQRKNAGKSTVGFINPVLYANPSALNDIVTGTNPGCSTNGFSAVSGWDPVTGLGTPDYVKLLKIWNNLA